MATKSWLKDWNRMFGTGIKKKKFHSGATKERHMGMSHSQFRKSKKISGLW